VGRLEQYFDARHPLPHNFLWITPILVRLRIGDPEAPQFIKTQMVQELEEHVKVRTGVGVRDFGSALEEQGIQIVYVEWGPTAGGDHEMIDLLDQLF
jgi:hypothetical protein